MRRGILIGRLLGTDIYCEPTFFLLIALYMWHAGLAAGAVFSAAVLVSILVHEFGHVLAVRRLLGVPSIVVLWMLGGLTIYRGAPRPGQQAAISLLGPAFSFALGGLSLGAYILLPEPPLLRAFLLMMTWINLVWTFANLLPALPLDGGQAVRAGLRAGLGREKADRLMRWISLLVAAAVISLAVALGYPYAAFLGALLLLENIRRPGIAYH
jgi:Zn-dependent protease